MIQAKMTNYFATPLHLEMHLRLMRDLSEAALMALEVGPPPTKVGEHRVIDNDGRYWIHKDNCDECNFDEWA